MGFIKANKQINNFFRYVSLSLPRINFISLIQGIVGLGEGVVRGFLFFFLKLTYSAQAISSPRFPFIIIPSPAFLNPGTPSSCPYHRPGWSHLPSAPALGHAVEPASLPPSRSGSFPHAFGAEDCRAPLFFSPLFFSSPFCERGELLPPKSAGLGGRGRSCKTEVHGFLIFSWATLTF